MTIQEGYSPEDLYGEEPYEDFDASVAGDEVEYSDEEQEMFENLESMRSVRSRMLSADEAITVVDANGSPDEVYARVRDVLGL